MGPYHGTQRCGAELYDIHGFFPRVDGGSTDPGVLGGHSLVSEHRYAIT